jgi:hypothetical protein
MGKKETIQAIKKARFGKRLTRYASVDVLFNALKLGEESGVSEKTIEEIYEEAKREACVPSPEWHKEILEQRANETDFTDWETVKERLKK